MAQNRLPIAKTASHITVLATLLPIQLLTNTPGKKAKVGSNVGDCPGPCPAAWQAWPKAYSPTA